MLKIELGTKIPVVQRLITQEIINEWADVAQDYNPLHVDPAYAKTQKFKGTIAHGPLSATMFFRMLVNWLGIDFYRHSEIEIRFTAPVRPGDTITAGGEVTNIEKKPDGSAKVGIEAVCENQHGEKVIVAKVMLEVGGGQ